MFAKLTLLFAIAGYAYGQTCLSGSVLGPCLSGECPTGSSCIAGECCATGSGYGDPIGPCINPDGGCPDGYSCISGQCYRLSPPASGYGDPIGPCIDINTGSGTGCIGA